VSLLASLSTPASGAADSQALNRFSKVVPIEPPVIISCKLKLAFCCLHSYTFNTGEQYLNLAKGNIYMLHSQGKIIFLNGASSSGKTTLAMALQATLEHAYLRLSLDDFISFLSPQYLPPLGEKAHELGVYIQPIISGFHKCIVELANTGNNIIVDHVLQEEEWLWECATLLQNADALFVGVQCSLPVLVQRECERGDREIGLAQYQYERVHRHNHYDVEVNTAEYTVEECVQRIISVVVENPSPRTFKLLVQKRIDRQKENISL
jgi:chloramphenicol 3-O phosphotransferase